MLGMGIALGIMAFLICCSALDTDGSGKNSADRIFNCCFIGSAIGTYFIGFWLFLKYIGTLGAE
jgi:hypothetical protein